MILHLSLILITTMPLITAPLLAEDVNYWWSGAGNNPGGSGAWDTTNPHFSTATNGPFSIVWDNNSLASDRANFALPAGHVDVATPINCRRLIIHGSGYSFSGNKITSDEMNNRFVIDKPAANLVVISNDFEITVAGDSNIRIRNQGGTNNPLILAGTFTFTDGTSTKRLDLDGTGANGSRIDFTGSLLDTPGATVRLRCGYNGGNRGNNASLYFLSGPSTYAGGTHIINGTVYVTHPNALGSGSLQLAETTTAAGDTVRAFLLGDVNIENNLITASASGGAIVTAVFGKAAGDSSESAVNGTVSLNSDTTLLNFHVAEPLAILTLTSLITDSTGVRGFLKTGAGTLVITGPNTYEGTTEVNEGTLLANSTGGSATGSGNVLVRTNATVGGTGRIGGFVTVEPGGFLAPGQSVGTIRINDLTLDTGSTVLWEKDAGTDVTDKAIVTNLVIAGSATVRVIPLTGAEPDGEVATNTIFHVVGSMSGFSNLSLDLSQTPGWDGGLVVMEDGLSIGVVLTPEPAAFAFFAFVLAVFARAHRTSA